jgi:hypothetical protein
VVDIEKLNFVRQHNAVPGHGNLKLLDSRKHQYGRNVVAPGTVYEFLVPPCSFMIPFVELFDSVCFWG